jgi:hypothetical protein
MAKKPKFPRDNPKEKYWRSMPLTTTDQKPFIALNEVTWDNLEEWHKNSRPKQAIRVSEHSRHKKVDAPLRFMESARNHTTRGRNKAERMMDRYWFVPPPDKTSYRENAFSKAIPRRQTIIYPPFLPKGRPAKKAQTERTCKHCDGLFEAKRADARFCGPKCRQAASRKRAVTDK